MKICKFTVLMLFILSSNSFSMDDYQSFAIEAEKHAHEQMTEYRQDVEEARNSAEQIMKTYRNEEGITSNQTKNTLMKDQIPSGSYGKNNRKLTSILIFVSFSMPRNSLEAYLRDAKRVHASVVIRGLMNDSFQKTFIEISTLVKNSGGDGVELNPLWFKRFGIKSVPAVVVVPDGSTCLKSDACSKEADFDMMTGDIALSSSLKMIRDKGHSTSGIAQEALAILEGGANA